MSLTSELYWPVVLVLVSPTRLGVHRLDLMIRGMSDRLLHHHTSMVWTSHIAGFKANHARAAVQCWMTSTSHPKRSVTRCRSVTYITLGGGRRSPNPRRYCNQQQRRFKQQRDSDPQPFVEPTITHAQSDYQQWRASFITFTVHRLGQTLAQECTDQ